MTEEALSEDEIEEKIEELDIWGVHDRKLATEIEFGNYKETVFFANSVYSLAEEHFHHPKVTVDYDTVVIDLWTHEVEGLTEKDFELAEAIEEKLTSMSWS